MDTFNFETKGFELLRLTIEEEQFYSNATQKNFSFYSVLLSTILAASTTGFVKYGGSLESLFFIIGPIVIIFIARLAKKNIDRYYQRHIEVISVRAKIEQSLGLTHKLSFSEHHYWKGESLYPDRFLDSRNAHDNSQNFIRMASKGGVLPLMKRVFTFFQLAGILLTVCGISLYLLNILAN